MDTNAVSVFSSNIRSILKDTNQFPKNSLDDQDAEQCAEANAVVCLCFLPNWSGSSSEQSRCLDWLWYNYVLSLIVDGDFPYFYHTFISDKTEDFNKPDTPSCYPDKCNIWKEVKQDRVVSVTHRTGHAAAPFRIQTSNTTESEDSNLLLVIH